MRSCGAHQPHAVSTSEQVARVRAAAAHPFTRRGQTSAGPAPDATNEGGPAHERRLRERGLSDNGQDTPAGQKYERGPVRKGTRQ